MMIIGCDFHTRMQQISMVDTETGEITEQQLDHENGEARSFYAGLKEPALVGIESTGYTRWFGEMLAEFGHELVVGDAAKIRARETRKQKHDRRDAEHILNLLVKGDFPKIWLPSAEERDVRVLIEHRHQLVQLRTRAMNGLQAVALNYGLRLRRGLWTKAGQEKLQKLPLREGPGRRRADLLTLITQINTWVKELDQRIEKEVERRSDAQLRLSWFHSGLKMTFSIHELGLPQLHCRPVWSSVRIWLISSWKFRSSRKLKSTPSPWQRSTVALLTPTRAARYLSRMFESSSPSGFPNSIHRSRASGLRGHTRLLLGHLSRPRRAVWRRHTQSHRAAQNFSLRRRTG